MSFASASHSFHRTSYALRFLQGTIRHMPIVSLRVLRLDLKALSLNGSFFVSSQQMRSPFCDSDPLPYHKVPQNANDFADKS